MAIVLIMKRLILYVFGVVLTIILTSCGTTTTLTEKATQTTSIEQKERVVYKDIVKDSIVYQEKVKNDTIFIRELRFKTREVHDTVWSYWAYSDTVYVDKYNEVIKEKVIKKTPWYNYLIISMLLIIIAYLIVLRIVK